MAKSKYESYPPPPGPKITKEDAKAEILKLFGRSVRPLLIGTAAIHLGSIWSIDKTEALFQELVEEGAIQQSSDGELSFVRVKP